MTASLPTGRRGQALAVALVALAAAVLWLGVAAPAWDWYAAQADRLARQELLAARVEAVAATVPALQRDLAAGGGAVRPALLDGGSEAIASAVLQGRLQEMSDRAGARLTSAEVLGAEPAGPYRRIRVRAAVTAGWPRLVALLSAVQGATPRMLVDDLQVGASRSVLPDQPHALDASFTAVALWAGPPR